MHQNTWEQVNCVNARCRELYCRLDCQVYIYSLVLECHSCIKSMWKGSGGNLLTNCSDWVPLHKRHAVLFICWWIFVTLLEIVSVKQPVVINLIATAVLSYSSTLVNKNLAAVFTLNSCLHKINKEKWRMFLLDKNNLSWKRGR